MAKCFFCVLYPVYTNVRVVGVLIGCRECTSNHPRALLSALTVIIMLIIRVPNSGIIVGVFSRTSTLYSV